MVDYSPSHLRDVIFITCTPILALNMHYFWSFGFNEDRERSNVRPTCDLRMYQLDGQRQHPVYGYVFVNQAFIFGRMLPACVAFAIAVMLARWRCGGWTLSDVQEIDRLRRFLLCGDSALALRQRTGPLILACYVTCSLVYTVSLVVFKALSLSRAISQCTLGVAALLHVIGQQAELVYFCSPIIVLLATNRQFRQVSDPRRLIS